MCKQRTVMTHHRCYFIRGYNEDAREEASQLCLGGKGFTEQVEPPLAGVCEAGTEGTGRKGVGRQHSRLGSYPGSSQKAQR